jgi:hypothetical protein
MAINTIGGNTLLQSGFFPPARVASTGSPLTPTTGGLLVVDGIQLVAGDRVLCKDETSAVNNGIYAANTGPWVRTSDATTNQQFFSGMGVVVALGTINARAVFLCTCTDDPVVVGTSLITFATAVPVGAGNVTGPGSSTIGDFATFADTTGKVLADTAATGTGSPVKATSPTLTTPTLGAATATTINNVAVTAPLSTATLTIASGKILTVDNTLELAGTDSTKFTFPSSSDTVVTLAATQTLTNKTLTNPVIASISGNSGATGTLSTGANAGTLGSLALNGSSAGTVTIKPQASAGTYNFNLPITAGSSGQVLTSSGGGGNAMSWFTPARFRVVATAVNFNSANTDTPITVTPFVATRYAVGGVRLNNANTSISTATVGVFTASGGGGQTIAANQSITVTATATDTVNNTMALTLTNSNTMAYNDATLQIRVGTAQGGAATADVCIEIIPLT